MNLPPELSEADRARAGASGVAARQARARIRVGLADGTLHLSEVLSMSEGTDAQARAVARMKVVELLSGLRGIGPVRAADAMAELGIAANRRVGGLGVHQRAALDQWVVARQERLGG